MVYSPNQDGASPLATSAADPAYLGRQACRRRAQARSRSPPRGASPASRSARRRPSRARDPAGGCIAPLPPLHACLPGRAVCSQGRLARDVSHPRILRAGRPHPSHRGGRGWARALEWCPRSRDPSRPQDQPCPRPARPGMGRSFPREGAHDAASGPPRARLRAHERSQARAPGHGDRSLLVGAMVRRVARGTGKGRQDGAAPCGDGAHLARARRVETARSDRAR